MDKNIEMMLRAGIISSEDLERIEFLQVEETLVKNNVKIPAVNVRQKGGSVQYCINVPARYSRTGKRHQIVCNTEEDVVKQFKKEAYDVIEHKKFESLADSATVESTVKMYIDSVAPDGGSGSVKKTTAERYLRCYVNHVKDTEFGKILLSHVKLYNCEEFISSLYKKNIGFGSIKQIKSLVSCAFDYAICRDFMVKNYMTGVKINESLCTGGTRHETGAWTDDEVKKLWIASKNAWENGRKYKYTAVNMLQIFTGCRIGELLALNWDDIDFERKTMKINKTVIRFTDYANRKKITGVDSTKTPESRRTIQLTDAALYWVKEIKSRNEQLGINSERVIVTRTGKLLKSDTIDQNFRKFCDSVGIKYRPSHAARRTYATMMIDAGVPLIETAADLGHKNVTTTQNAYYKSRSEKDDIMKQKNEVFATSLNLASIGIN